MGDFEDGGSWGEVADEPRAVGVCVNSLTRAMQILTFSYVAFCSLTGKHMEWEGKLKWRASN